MRKRRLHVFDSKAGQSFDERQYANFSQTVLQSAYENRGPYLHMNKDLFRSVENEQ